MDYRKHDANGIKHEKELGRSDAHSLPSLHLSMERICTDCGTLLHAFLADDVALISVSSYASLSRTRNNSKAPFYVYKRYLKYPWLVQSKLILSKRVSSAFQLILCTDQIDTNFAVEPRQFEHRCMFCSIFDFDPEK